MSAATARLRETTARAKSQATPVFTHTIGGPAEVRDLEVEVQRPQELAFVRQQVPVAVTLRQRGSLAAQATLALLLEGKEIEKRTARLVPNGTTEQVFNVKQDAAGLFRYEVLADPLPGEVTAANNSSPLLLRVVDQPVRVLLLEGKPYWDTKFLIRTLATDESIELTASCSLPKAGSCSGRSRGKTRPPTTSGRSRRTPDKFLADRADAGVVPDRDPGPQRRGLPQRRGPDPADEVARPTDGSLVCFRGAPSSKISQRLDELMPVRWTASAETRFRAQWTDEGQALRWLPGEGERRSADRRCPRWPRPRSPRSSPTWRPCWPPTPARRPGGAAGDIGRPAASAAAAWSPWKGPACGAGPSFPRSTRTATNFMVRSGGASSAGW